MKKTLGIFLLSAIALLADSVVFTPPAPGKITVATTSGRISGSFTGNAVPATAVAVALTVDGVPINYTIPLTANQSYTGSNNFTSGTTDAITYNFSANGTGQISFQITLNGAAPVTGNF